jgi:copper(I)-binding protein
MLQGLKHALKSGDRATLVLTFAKAGRVRVLVNVRATAAADSMAGMKM